MDSGGLGSNLKSTHIVYVTFSELPNCFTPACASVEEYNNSTNLKYFDVS